MVYYMSLSICSLHYYLIYSKISFTIFDTKNARDSKKYSYINHIEREIFVILINFVFLFIYLKSHI